jgi:hypothetical protein
MPAAYAEAVIYGDLLPRAVVAVLHRACRDTGMAIYAFFLINPDNRRQLLCHHKQPPKALRHRSLTGNFPEPFDDIDMPGAGVLTLTASRAGSGRFSFNMPIMAGQQTPGIIGPKVRNFLSFDRFFAEKPDTQEPACAGMLCGRVVHIITSILS